MFLRRAFAGGRHLTSNRLSCALLPTHCSLETPLSPRYAVHASTANSSRSFLDDSTVAHDLRREVESFHQAVVAQQRPPRLRILEKFSENPPEATSSSLLELPIRSLLENAMLRLSESTSSEHQSVLRRVLRMTARVLRKEVAEYVTIVFTSAMGRDEVRAASDWLCGTGGMSELDPVSMLPLWHQLLEHAAQRRNDYLISMHLKKMVRLKVKPTSETCKIVVTALLRSPSYNSLPSYEMMKHVLNVFSSAGLAYDEEIGRSICAAYTAAGKEELGRQVNLLYFTVSAQRDDDPSAEVSMHRVLASLSSQGNREKVFRQYRRFRELGLQPSDDTLAAVMGNTATLANLKYWRATLGIKGGSRTCAKVMERLVNGDALSSQKALAFYKSECGTGILPNSDMLHLVICTLLSNGLGKPSITKVDEAVQLYQDFITRHGLAPKTDHPAESSVLDDLPSSPADSPKACTYQLLLRALTLTQNMPKHIPVAVSLVEDMKRFHVRLDPQSTTSILILLMRSSSTPSEAFAVYRLVSHPANNNRNRKPVLNDEGYNAVLHTFCNLSFWPHGIPSTRQYFDIVTDMRKHGFKLNAKAYTIILRQLAALATAAPPDSDARGLAAKAIKRVHNHLTVNTAFTPDTPLLNQLMDAYQRAGCFMEAVQVWRQLYTSRQFTNASVSIILDACAFAKAYDMAVRIYTMLLEAGYPMNLRNWNAFLECLCRLNRLDEAMKVLFLEMTGRDDGIAPDVESVRILTKFAKQKNQVTEVLSRVKRFLPKLYHSLPDHLRSTY